MSACPSRARRSAHLTRWVAALVALLASSLLMPRVAAARQLERDSPAFKMTIPDEYEEVPPAPAKKDQVALFHKPTNLRGGLGLFIGVDRMHGVLGRKPISSSEIEKFGPGATALTMKWKTFDVQAFRVPTEINGGAAVGYVAQVPLQPEAIQVKILCDAAQDEEGKAVLQSVLATVEGESNWISASERGAGGGNGRMLAVGAVVLVAAVVGLLRYQSARRAKTSS